MRHLTEDQLLDLAEGVTLESASVHLTTCEACRSQIEDLRRTLSAVQAVAVPEPSPLFWDHLSARVRDAVAAEPVAPQVSRWGWLTTWRLTAAMTAAVAVLAVALVVREAPAPVVPGPVSDPGTVVATEPGLAAEAMDVADDPSLRLLAELTDGLDWDGATEAGFSVSAGVTDLAMGDLSADERIELRRLLNEALTSGASVL